ncbi:deoxyribodipyrimidine photo-lyase [Methanofollis sp. W23]|uniref:deoxyribodipyrimidine photo-lyase n=1 Tax=Methanofollis sp. W23 TaxID=2817849 RepID=UPI001AE9C841|nr:deoxyribodipyrimidine photo-lyase [Methanofollis sp. W23]MBP2144916.1 deoxyribodipyrimidine photo-lyase [Methanofollis sp. W23]
MIRRLNRHAFGNGRHVLYWMQASQRPEWNPALEYAITQANALKKSLVVVFCLDPRGEGRQARHLRFMLEGLSETRERLAARGIGFVLRPGPPAEGVAALGEESALVVADRGYLRGQVEDRALLADRLAVSLVEVEGDVVVPVETASRKEEWSAATFRRRVARHLDPFPAPPVHHEVRVRSADDETYDSLRLDRLETLLRTLGAEEDAGPGYFTGGLAAARQLLDQFVRERLEHYATERNDPNADVLSCMSPYLHFGQISPLEIAPRVRAVGDTNAAAYLEELIVRRELSMNFVHYNPAYASLQCLPAWAATTLEEHAGDPREYDYALADLEAAATHDPYWNAAQRELLATGKMHGYMRMYWGKKVIEWSSTPEDAYHALLVLNNRYELDGRDPNSYAGVAWCFGKHDRAWKERPIFGKVRYMNARGLRRKFDADRYAKRFGE